MDGWESRRRRTPGHDFCIVKLGLPGVIRGVDVDTSHFKGNYPESCSIDAACAPTGLEVESLGGAAAPWTEILPITALNGDSRNLFPINARGRFTHIRLQIYPDGGVARLRVHGDVVPEWSAVVAGQPIDLVALENGGLVLLSSDSFFGSHQNLLMPGRGASMKDGWETKRSRRPGFDWVIVRLGTRGLIQSAEVDTNHFKGNFPDSCLLEACDAPAAALDALTSPSREWRVLLPETKLQAHTQHFFTKELLPAGTATHVRMRIYPDGGVSRLRLFGLPEAPEALVRLNEATPDDATALLLRCCGSSRWASRLAGLRPFATHLSFLGSAEDLFAELLPEDWLEAFRAHPKIGDRAALAARFGSTREWAEGEQAGALVAEDAVLEELATSNAAYEARFGYLFIICATGRSAPQMLASLRDRLANPHDIELGVAASEQRKITRLRMEKLLLERSQV